MVDREWAVGRSPLHQWSLICTGIVASYILSETSNEIKFGEGMPINQPLLSSDTWKECPYVLLCESGTFSENIQCLNFRLILRPQLDLTEKTVHQGQKT